MLFKRIAGILGAGRIKSARGCRERRNEPLITDDKIYGNPSDQSHASGACKARFNSAQTP